jgi:hypothetical protein
VAGALDAEADRQPVDGALAHQRVDLPRPCDGEIELSAHPQPAGVLGDGKPAADRLGRIVLPEHPHATDAAAREAVGEGARQDHVLAEVGDAEEARIALEHAVLRDARKRHRKELHLADDERVIPGRRR